MHSLLWLAIVLAIVWVVLRFALALTGVAFHLIWILAVVMFIVWIFGVVRGGPTTPV